LTSVAKIRRFFTQPSPWQARLLDPEWRRSGVDFHRFFTKALNQDSALMRRLTNVNKRLLDELNGLVSFDVALISTGGWAFAQITHFVPLMNATLRPSGDNAGCPHLAPSHLLTLRAAAVPVRT